MVSLSTEQKKAYFKEIWEKSDRIILYALWAYFLFGLFLAFFYDTWLVGLSVGSLSLLSYFAARFTFPKGRLHQYVASGLLAIFMAQFIYQMHGLFEMHFFAFIGATLLITYQNWKLFIPLALLVVIHHASFAYLQYSGVEDIYFTQLQYMDLQTFLFHAGLAVLIIGICTYWAYDLAQKTISEKQTSVKLGHELENVERGIRFASEISKGNLHVEFEDVDQQNALSEALLTMQQSLQEANKREKQEQFINQGLSRINDILRANLNDLNELSDRLLKELVNYLGVNQAGLFLVESEDDKAPSSLRLTACYAYNRKKFIERTIEIREGLVGQAYLERDIIYMTDVPQGYTTITSGLGEATPSCILIMPLMSNEEVAGVLELASLSPLSEEHINFIKKVSESIASSIQASQINDHTKKLLQSLQENAEEMRTQEEEMRQNMEELSATQEEMTRRSNEYEQLLKERNKEIEELKKQLV